MKEPISNIGHICDKHSKERHKQWQKENKTLALSPGDMVKLKFIDKGKKKPAEYMWVEILQSLDDNTFVGELNNDPFLLHDWVNGDHLGFNRSEIQDHMLKS